MRTASFLFILVWVTLPSTLGQQPIHGGSEAAIRALEHEWVDGQARNNNRALDLIFDNALVYVEYGKLVTKGEYLSRIKRAGPQINQIFMEPMSVRLFGRTAIVIGTYREKLAKGGKPGIKRWRFIDTWVYEKNGWVLVAAAATPLTQHEKP
jgi:Domain of unknown function (DUF4440)